MRCYLYIFIVIIIMIMIIFSCLLVFKKRIYYNFISFNYKNITDEIEYPDTNDDISSNILKYMIKELDKFNIEIFTKQYCITDCYYINNKKKQIVKIIKKDNVAWVFVRGTHTFDEFEQDLRLYHATVYDKYKCHAGFVNIFNRIIVKLINIIDNIKPKKIYCIGHSLGGGLLTIAALGLFRLYNNIVIITIGTPRCCDINYSRELEDKKIYKIINISDTFVDSVPSVIPFTNFVYEHTGKLITFNDNKGDIMTNHSLKTYFDNVDKFKF